MQTEVPRRETFVSFGVVLGLMQDSRAGAAVSRSRSCLQMHSSFVA